MRQIAFLIACFSTIFIMNTVLVSCSGGSCKADRDCDKGSFCKNDTCTYECRINSDCEKGESCNARGKCTPRNPSDEKQEEQPPIKKDATIPPEKQPDKAVPNPICKQDTDCPANHTCSQTGQCLKKDSNCTQSDCVVNDTRCIGALLQVCERDAKGCGRWGTSSPCNTGEKCSAGKCVKTCASTNDCALGKFCNGGECQDCKNPCQRGQTKCEGNAVVSCVENHGCFSWGSASSCAQKEVCSAGKCVSNSKCAAVTCSSNTYCDEADGKCKPDCTRSGCASHQQCNQTTKQCEKKPGCTSHNQCGSGKYCDKVKGTCHNSYVLSLKSCNSSNCSSGYTCVRMTSAGNDERCFPSCRSDADCGSHTCTTLSSGAKVCMKRAPLGEFCDASIAHYCKRNQYPYHYCSKTTHACTAEKINTTVGAKCNKDGDDSEPIQRCDKSKQIYCEQSTGTCAKGNVVGLYESCKGSGVCVTNQVCTSFSSGNRYCFNLCSGDTDPSCNGQCEKLRSGRYHCSPYGTSPTDGFCDTEPATKRELSKLCGKDHTCVSAKKDTTKGVCSRIYPSGCAGKCPTTHACVPLSGGSGACIRKCSGPSDTCPAAEAKCQYLSSQYLCFVP